MANPSHHVPSHPAAPDEPAPRFTLRHLPFAAKLVLSTFLLAVGVGYTSAMVQLHMQHGDRDGKPLPTMENVVAVFAGKVWKNPGEVVDSPSKLETVVMGNPTGSISGSNMAPAFFAHDEADYAKQAKQPGRKEKLDQERDGERKALVAWAKAAPETRAQAYKDNRFKLPKELEKLVLTVAYTDKSNPGTVLVRQLLEDRCVRCHKPGGEKGDIPLTTYEEVAALMPTAAAIPEGGGYVDSGRQIGLEKLTQSTHAHLLSFAVLFTCTGLVFAFTGLPGIIRGTVGPIVLIAQVADIACWWLARLPEPYGPGFAKAIMGTGAVVGVGLMLHIVCGLFGMYGPKGKTLLVLLFAGAAGGGAAAWTGVIDPFLKAEKAKVEQKAAAEKEARDKDKQKVAPKDEGKGVPVQNGGPSGLERVLTGPWKDAKWVADGKVPDGGMVRAFFDKESDFKDALKSDPELLAKLTPQREGERDAFLAWVKAAPEARKKGYDDDAFPLPEALVGKATPEFLDKDGKRLKVKLLVETRCLSCHADGADVPLDTFEGLSRYFAPRARE
ncbi:hypothetical protein [Urbifossiella limnaea]|uniref:Uncharacterized protein n=1 Tax=Urbifossiella limnaea TaxID=2528023 RepID=A0A517XNV5_9BACT|nr:hypothetical protein [Urbifossiella limnaea]QDU19191.1 hypothetical protein ETAA1_10950 [Urbifossiella limnaea]